MKPNINSAPQTKPPEKALPASKRKKAPKKSLRERMTLVNYIRLITAMGVIIASIIAGGYAFSLQYEKALMDTWAIIYLNAERNAQRIDEELREYTSLADRTDAGRSVSLQDDFRKPKTIFKIINTKTAMFKMGRTQKDITAKSLGIKNFNTPVTTFIHVLRKRAYYIQQGSEKDVRKYFKKKVEPGRYLLAWSIKISKVLKDPYEERGSKIQTYFSTRTGTLLYTNSLKMKQSTFNNRVLVQKFSMMNLRSGEIEFENKKGHSIYGAFYEVPNTNIMMFTEYDKAQALDNVNQLIKKFFIALLIIVTTGLFLLQWPLRAVVRPIKDLVRLSMEISQGNFKAKPNFEGYGELGELTAAFTRMSKNLDTRERALKELMAEQQEKVRMAREMDIAKNVQDSFLPNNPLSIKSGIVLGSRYIPATQCAGDWYSYHYNPKTEETIIAIADVSGHDIAASMYTAVIAAMFHDIREAYPESFPLKEFASRLNRRIYSFGQGNWHATLQVVKYTKGVDLIEILNCGQTFPIIIDCTGDKPKHRIIKIPSNPVGLEAENHGKIKTAQIKAGETVLLYTDGVTEAKDEKQKNFGTKKLVATMKSSGLYPVDTIIEDIIKACDAYSKGAPATDDICIVAFRPVG